MSIAISNTFAASRIFLNTKKEETKQSIAATTKLRFEILILIF